MNRSQLEHIIRAASQIAGDSEIVVIGSQAVHAQKRQLPAAAFISQEADLYPKNHPERADDIDGAIGELSMFHETFGYYAQGVSPETAILPEGWQERLIPLKVGEATGLCLDVHDLVLAKYAANREKDRAFNRALVEYECVERATLIERLEAMPIEEAQRHSIRLAIQEDFDAAKSRPG